MTTPDTARRRLGEINDELRTLTPSDFAARHRLATEADRLRQTLTAVSPEDADILAEWADRSTRTPDHRSDDESQPGALISSPSEGGGVI